MIKNIPQLGENIIIDGAATLEFQLFLEELASASDTVTETVDALGGTWELLDTYNVTGDPATYEYTWDETTYSEIKVKFSTIQPATDALSLFAIVGSDNGATMYNSTNDYDGSEKLYESATWSSLVDTDKVRIGPNFSNAANETGSGDLLITASDDSDLGCLMRCDLLYINSVSNQRANEVKAFLDFTSGAIDTVRLFWTSGNFANVGTIRVYGLKR